MVLAVAAAAAALVNQHLLSSLRLHAAVVLTSTANPTELNAALATLTAALVTALAAASAMLPILPSLPSPTLLPLLPLL